ncbi:MAG: hypothetical protein RL284_1930 [Bacteroidota bacterium]
MIKVSGYFSWLTKISHLKKIHNPGLLFYPIDKKTIFIKKQIPEPTDTN